METESAGITCGVPLEGQEGRKWWPPKIRWRRLAVGAIVVIVGALAYANVNHVAGVIVLVLGFCIMPGIGDS